MNIFKTENIKQQTRSEEPKLEVKQAKLKEARNSALNELYQQLAKTALVGLIPPPPQVVIRRPVASVGLRAWDRLALWRIIYMSSTKTWDQNSVILFSKFGYK
ncbi:MAG: hypothetical protein EZS28_009240 [Streblomastix strix]|uniref:Uncharacterized protein n=1 Tax=Streblomastix strix TaxID=222440 RepID=A0A5J4WJW8_9EUKA|nr:MAG: hypothetical protein EZS28_009240 [Streblomastix strix]